MDWIQRVGGGTRAGGEGRRGGEPADLGGQARAGPRRCQVALSPGTLMGAVSASRNVSQNKFKPFFGGPNVAVEVAF